MDVVEQRRYEMGGKCHLKSKLCGYFTGVAPEEGGDLRVSEVDGGDKVSDDGGVVVEAGEVAEVFVVRVDCVVDAVQSGRCCLFGGCLVAVLGVSAYIIHLWRIGQWT